MQLQGDAREQQDHNDHTGQYQADSGMHDAQCGNIGLLLLGGGGGCSTQRIPPALSET